MTQAHHTAQEKQHYLVRDHFNVFVGKSVFGAGKIIALDAAAALANAHKIELAPPPGEAPYRAPPVVEDVTVMAWFVREGFYLTLGDVFYKPGDIVLATLREASMCAGLERLPDDGIVPSYPAAVPDMTVRPWRVRARFFPRRGEACHKPGDVLHLLDSEAGKYAHMIEPVTEDEISAPAAAVVRVVERVKRAGGKFISAKA